MARGVLERFVEPKRRDALFERPAQRQYTRALLFSTLVDRLRQVVLGVQPAVHAAYQARNDRIPVRVTAVYDQLQGVAPAVSAALREDSAHRAAPLIRALGTTAAPGRAGDRTRILDGNHFAAPEHRLEELRSTWAAPVPGKLLAGMDPELTTVPHVRLCEDGQAQERSLLDDVGPRVERRDLGRADRNCCTRTFLFGSSDRGGGFVIRQPGAVPGAVVGARTQRRRCSPGWVWEEKLRLRDAGRKRVVRRITVELDQPTREGDREIHLLTTLPKKGADATAVAELYRKRWTIEGLFLEVSQTLEGAVDTLGYPKAALVTFGRGRLAYNAVAVLKAALRAVHGEAIQEQWSSYDMALEIQQCYDGMRVAVPAKHGAVFGRWTDAEMAAVLREWASQVRWARSRKHPRGPKQKPPQRRRYRNGEHVATAKILAARKSRK
jgi:hypothetical protein